MESNEVNKSSSPTPIPWKKLIGAYVLLLCEAITTTSLFSYISPFIIFLHVTDKKEEVGFYGGYIASCFSAAQFLSSYFWGGMSDRWGRKPILIIGSIGSILSVLSVGISWSLPMLIASRSINGLLNGNIGVVKTYIGECTDKTNQIEAFGWIGLTWGIGSLLGPAIGGLLADPASLYPSVFGHSKLFLTFPFLLPNLLLAIITSIGCAFTYFFMNETLNIKKSKSISMSNLSNKSKFTILNNQEEEEEGEEETTRKAAESKVVDKIGLNIGRFEEDIDEKELNKLNISISDKLNQSSSEYKIHQEEESTTNVILIDEAHQNSINMVDENENEVVKKNLLENSSLKNEDEEYDLARDKAKFEDISLDENDSSNSFLRKSYTLFKNKLFKKSTSMANIKSSKSYQHLKQVNSEVDLTLIDNGQNQQQEINIKKKSKLPSCTGDENSNIFKNKLIMATTFLYCFVGFIFTMWDEAFPIWAFTDINKGGLQMDGRQVGLCSIIGGASVILIQIFLIKPTIKRFGVVKIFGVGNLLAVFSFFSFPLLNYVAPLKLKGTGSILLFWLFMTLVLILRNIAAQFVFTPIMTLINNASISKLRGSANGLGQSLVALTRTIGPTLASILLSWSLTNGLSFPFNHFFVFVLMSICAIIPYVSSKFLPLSLNAPIQEDNENKEDEMQIPVFE